MSKAQAVRQWWLGAWERIDTYLSTPVTVFECARFGVLMLLALLFLAASVLMAIRNIRGYF